MDILWDKGMTIKDGDFAIGENTDAHAEFILTASKGNMFWVAALGFGANGKINSDINEVELQGEMIRELKSQRIKLKSFSKNSADEFDISVAKR